MKILVTGANGQVGQELVALSATLSVHQVVALTKSQLDIANIQAVAEAVERYQPQVVVNAAAYTKVDVAETEVKLNHQVNVEGPENLAKVCQAKGIPLIHISTDYVFDGTASMPYQEDHPAAPVNAYGQAKLAGERAVQKQCQKYLILRTSWVFSTYGHNFVKTMLKLMQDRETLSIVSDQIGGPTYAKDIARTILVVMEKLTPDFQAWGVYHYAGEPTVSWFEFAQQIMPIAQQRGGKIQHLIPIKTVDYPTPAKRPLYSVLSQAKIQRVFGVKPSDWKRALQEAFL